MTTPQEDEDRRLAEISKQFGAPGYDLPPDYGARGFSGGATEMQSTNNQSLRPPQMAEPLAPAKQVTEEQQERIKTNLLSLIQNSEEVDDAYLGAIKPPPSPTGEGPNPEISSPHKKVSHFHNHTKLIFAEQCL